MRVRRKVLLTLTAIWVPPAIVLAFTGSVVLFYPQREVASAELVDGRGQRQNHTFMGIGYVSVPKLEDSVKIRCISGKDTSGGYVSPGIPTWQRMNRKGNCSIR